MDYKEYTWFKVSLKQDSVKSSKGGNLISSDPIGLPSDPLEKFLPSVSSVLG